MKSRGGPPLWLKNSRGGPPFFGCMLMNSRGGLPILRGGPPLGTISMDHTVQIPKWFYHRVRNTKKLNSSNSFQGALFDDVQAENIYQNIHDLYNYPNVLFF